MCLFLYSRVCVCLQICMPVMSVCVCFVSLPMFACRSLLNLSPLPRGENCTILHQPCPHRRNQRNRNVFILGYWGDTQRDCLLSLCTAAIEPAIIITNAG